MVLDPQRDEWPLTCTESEQRIAAALVGSVVLRVEYDADGDWEASYLRLEDKTVAVAAVRVEGRFGLPGWPWRLAFLEIQDPTHPTKVEFAAPGRVESLDFYEQDGVQSGLALRCTDQVLWFRCAGGDYVKAESGERPRDFSSLRLARRLSL
jgi:hypothetical protein